MDQPEVLLPGLLSVPCLQYANFVLQAKNAADEATLYNWCVQILLLDVVVPETHRNSLRELKLWTFEQEFCMVGGYTEDLTKHRTVKIGGWALA